MIDPEALTLPEWREFIKTDLIVDGWVLEHEYLGAYVSEPNPNDWTYEIWCFRSSNMIESGEAPSLELAKAKIEAVFREILGQESPQ